MMRTRKQAAQCCNAHVSQSRYLRLTLLSLLLVSILSVVSLPKKPVPYGLPALAVAQAAGEEQNTADQLADTGQEYLDLNQFSAAIPVFRQALQLYEQQHNEEQVQQARKGLAAALLLSGDPLGAIPLYKQLIQQTDILPIRSAFLSHLGLAYYRTEQFKAAEQALRNSIHGWETIRDHPGQEQDNITLLEQQAHTYRLLQKVLVAMERYEAALLVAEQSRSRSLVEKLVQGLGATPTPAPTLATIQQTARDRNTTLVTYSVFGSEERVLGTEPATETHLFIWVVPPSGHITFREVPLKGSSATPLRDLVNLARNEIAQLKTSPAALKSLYTLVINPIEDQLPEEPGAPVIFIPHGPLYLVPFAALQAPSGEYLVQSHTLTVAPSILTLSLTNRSLQQPERQCTILVVANPEMPAFPSNSSRSAQSLANLPGAEKEGAMIAALFNTRSIRGKQATEERLVKEMPAFNIIHLATHGVLDMDAGFNEFGELLDPDAPTARDFGVHVNPGSVVVGDNVFIGGTPGKEAVLVIGSPEGKDRELIPARIALAREKVVRIDLPGLLALAPSTREDGFLTAKEITRLKLKAELVVLSACDTGRGRITEDGVIGLARSFMAAGVPSVVMSLWPVPDSSTADLMKAFYRNLGHHLDKGQALRQAMLKTMKQYPHPIHWSTFVLMGETASNCTYGLLGQKS